jgi:hypothetical protein
MSSRALPGKILFFPIFAMMAFGSIGCGLLDLLERKPTLADIDIDRAKVELSLDAETMVHFSLVAKAGTCPSITSDVVARVDDQRMDLFMRGGEQPTKTGWVCGSPTFRKALAEDKLGGDKTRFEAKDDSARVALEFEGLLVARELMPIKPSPTVQPGTEITFAWSPLSDALDEESLTVDFTYDDKELGLPAPPVASIGEGSIRVRIPQGAPAGKGTLRVDASIHLSAVTCEGAPVCEALVHVSPTLALEVGEEVEESAPEP